MQHSNSDHPIGHEKRLAAIKIQLHSQLPSDVRRGKDQAGKLLQEDPSNQEIYQLLLGVAKETPSQREEIKNLFQFMANRSSKEAKEALNVLESYSVPGKPDQASSNDHTTADVADTEHNHIDDADDAYYAGEFDKAISLYRKVLQEEPNNKRAQQQLDKAELNRLGQQPNRKLPREAMQNYRRARSFIAARDIVSAVGMLNAAIEEAQAHEMRFQEAEELLGSQVNLEIAYQFKQQANELVQKERWDDALEKYGQILKLDPFDEISRSMYEKLRGLIEAESILVTLRESLDDETSRKEKLASIASSIKAGEGIIKITKTSRFKKIRAQYGLYKAESDLHKWRTFTALAPQRQVTSIFRVSKDILDPDDPALKYVEDQLERYKRTRLITLIVFAATLILIFILFLRSKSDDIPPDITSTITPTLTLSITKTLVPTKTATATVTPSSTFTPTLTATVSSTAVSLDTGYINRLIIHPQDNPNGKRIGQLTRFQAVTILDQKVVSGDQWYFCQWEDNGTTQKGWILAEYVTIGPSPISPTPTP